MGFKGSSVHTINENGRLSIPSKMRDVLGKDYSDDTLVLVINNRGFLLGFPTVEWEKREADLRATPPQTKMEADFRRRLFSRLEEVNLDKQGRILISPVLREAAGLIGDCMVLGHDDHIEIWDKGRWDNDVSDSFDGLDGPDGMGKQFSQLIL